MTDDDINTLASYIEGEAGGEGRIGMQAVANVMANRAAQNYGGYGRDLVRQASAPNQFQGYHRPSAESISVAKDLVAGNLPDVTGGAIYYARPENSTAAWARRLNESNAYRIGHHYFTSNVEGVPFRGPGYPAPEPTKIASVDHRRPDDRLARHGVYDRTTTAARRDDASRRIANLDMPPSRSGDITASPVLSGSDNVPFVVTTTVTVSAV